MSKYTKGEKIEELTETERREISTKLDILFGLEMLKYVAKQGNLPGLEKMTRTNLCVDIARRLEFVTTSPEELDILKRVYKDSCKNIKLKEIAKLYMKKQNKDLKKEDLCLELWSHLGKEGPFGRQLWFQNCEQSMKKIPQEEKHAILLEAIRDRDADSVAQLLKIGANPNVGMKLAARLNSFDITKLLSEHGANAVSGSREAALYGNLELSKHLYPRLDENLVFVLSTMKKDIEKIQNTRGTADVKYRFDKIPDLSTPEERLRDFLKIQNRINLIIANMKKLKQKIPIPDAYVNKFMVLQRLIQTNISEEQMTIKIEENKKKKRPTVTSTETIFERPRIKVREKLESKPLINREKRKIEKEQREEQKVEFKREELVKRRKMEEEQKEKMRDEQIRRRKKEKEQKRKREDVIQERPKIVVLEENREYRKEEDESEMKKRKEDYF